jgi:hypothetical protein
MRPTVIIATLNLKDFRWRRNVTPELRGIFGEAVDIEINHDLVWPSGDNAAETTDSDCDILPEEEPGYDSQEDGERENPDDVESFDRREVWITTLKMLCGRAFLCE